MPMVTQVNYEEPLEGESEGLSVQAGMLID